MDQSRYSRQQLLPQIAAAGQRKLADATVVLVGAGGLGCQVGSHLAGAGLGQIRLIDHDCIEISNLHRQILFRESDIGQPKARVAARELSALNSEVAIDGIVARVNPANIEALLADADLVIDAADNFATSWLLSDACLAAGVALLSASVNQSFGYLGVFCGSSVRSAPSFRALFPRLPIEQTSCDLVGVTGPAVGVIGSLQAQEAIKVLLDDEQALFGQLMYVDLWKYAMHKIDFSQAHEPGEQTIGLISTADVRSDDCVIDVRNADEIELSAQPFAVHHHIPLPDLAGRTAALKIQTRIVCACRSGQRALIAAQLLADAGHADVAAVVPDA